MEDKKESLHSLLSVYNEKNLITSDSKLPVINVSEIIASIFCPGEYYYFITNFFDVRFEYVHPTIESIIGCDPAEFNLPMLIERMHPDDAQLMMNKEAAAAEFFFRRIPLEKVPYYKSSYTFRLSNNKQEWRNILHQSITINVTDDRIHRSLVVHTDITYMDLQPDSRISFIGINSEPSFYSLSTDPKNILEPDHDWTLSWRELDIVKLLCAGMASKQIADALSISTHTVDTHRRNLLRKTGTKNTLELAVVCVKRGLV